LADSKGYYKRYTSCYDAFANGKIHPEPGKPVQLVLQDNTAVNCSAENIYMQSAACPTGWYGDATGEFCYQGSIL
jgi:hypothetical protein